MTQKKKKSDWLITIFSYVNIKNLRFFVTRDLSTHWVLKVPLCDSRSAHIGNATWGSQAGFVHTTRGQKLWTRNMKGFQFLGARGNQSAQRKPTKVGMELANQIYIHHWLAALVKWKSTSTKPTSPTTGVAVLEWVRTRESGSESESTRPESESESESIRPESESIRCESESIGPESESESESIGPESESESSGSESESESASPTKVRVSPDSAWTHESNSRKVLYFDPTFNHFCWTLYW